MGKGIDYRKETGGAFVEGAIVLSVFVLVILTAYLTVLPRINAKILGMDLERAMQAEEAVSPDVVLYELNEATGEKKLLDENIIQSQLHRMVNRLAYSVGHQLKFCAIAIQVSNTSGVCSGTQPDRTSISTILGVNYEDGAYKQLDVVSGGSFIDACPQEILTAVSTDTNGCLQRFKNFVYLDCLYKDGGPFGKNWGVLLVPFKIEDGTYDLQYMNYCGVVSPRYAQIKDSIYAGY